MTVAQKRKLRLPPEMREISGLTYLPDGTLWAINDSGNEPVLYQLNPHNGQIMARQPLPVPNVDWEDLQTDPHGNFWIGDVGNNQSKRRKLVFYRYHRATGQLDSTVFSYPDQTEFPPATQVARAFDVEAFVWANDTLHLFTKSRFAGNHFTKHYLIPAQPGVQTPILRDSFYLPKRAVTGAALSPDGKTLVLIAYFVKKRWFRVPFTRATAYFFSNFPNQHYFSGQMTKKRLPKFAVARQFESVAACPNGKWRLANEGILWQKPRLWTIRGKY